MNLEDAVAKYISTTNTAQDEAEKYRQVLENINNNNYGEGYEDIANSMAQVKMQLKDINEQDLQNITEKAIALRDLFGYDVSESVRAVKALMDNFNVSADEAFNLITEGKKQGLDFSNELLDNVNEYSVQFNKLGLSAQDMFNIFKVGADNGAFNLDKIGDAVKEFSIRAIDGSNTTIDGFKRIGLNVKEMEKKFAAGGETAKKAFIEVVNRLGNMDDKVSQSIAGVDLFGTMWEDLGPTVVTSFSKMDNGISQSSDSMQESIDELYNTTKKKAETQLKKLQSLGADFGEEMLPVLEDLIEMAEDFIKKLEGMSDAEKENIVKIGLLVAGAGPLTKAIGTAGKTIGTVTKGMGLFSQAIAVATNKTTSNITSVNNLAKAFTALTSPTGLLIAGFAGITTAAVLYEKHQQELFGNSATIKKAIDEEVEARNKLIETQNNNISNSLSEINRTQELYNELKTITDENGKIKKGYENRANYITNQLSEALGIEINLNDGVIDSYQKLQEEIDKTILKKKAENIISGQEESYNNALQQRAKAYETLNQLETDYQNLLNQYGANPYDSRAKLAMNSLKNQLKTQKELINSYNEDIAKYDKNYSLLIENTTDSLNELIRNNEVGISSITNDTYNGITTQISYYSKLVEDYKRLKQEQLDTGNEYNIQAYADQEESNKKQLEQLAVQLSEITTITNVNEPVIQEAWKNIAENSSDTFFNIISEMPEDLQIKILELSGVIRNDTTVRDSTTDLAKSAEEGFNNNVDGAKWGSDLTKEMSQSMTNSKSKQRITSASSTVAGWISQFLHFSVPDKGPLSDMDESMPDMIDLMTKGIYSSKSKLLKATEKLSQDLKDRLMLNSNMSFEKLESIQGGVISKTIDSNKNIFTTPQIIFNVQELDEARLQQCFDYINRKFGSQY